MFFTFIAIDGVGRDKKLVAYLKTGLSSEFSYDFFLWTVINGLGM